MVLSQSARRGRRAKFRQSKKNSLRNFFEIKKIVNSLELLLKYTSAIYEIDRHWWRDCIAWLPQMQTHPLSFEHPRSQLPKSKKPAVRPKATGRPVVCTQGAILVLPGFLFGSRAYTPFVETLCSLGYAAGALPSCSSLLLMTLSCHSLTFRYIRSRTHT